MIGPGVIQDSSVGLWDVENRGAHVMGGKLEVQAGKAGFMSLAQGFRLYLYCGQEGPSKVLQGE